MEEKLSRELNLKTETGKLLLKTQIKNKFTGSYFFNPVNSTFLISYLKKKQKYYLKVFSLKSLEEVLFRPIDPFYTINTNIGYPKRFLMYNSSLGIQESNFFLKSKKKLFLPQKFHELKYDIDFIKEDFYFTMSLQDESNNQSIKFSLLEILIFNIALNKKIVVKKISLKGRHIYRSEENINQITKNKISEIPLLTKETICFIIFSNRNKKIEIGKIELETGKFESRELFFDSFAKFENYMTSQIKESKGVKQSNKVLIVASFLLKENNFCNALYSIVSSSLIGRTGIHSKIYL